MLKDRMQRFGHFVERAVTQPRDELSRWQRTLRFAYDLGRYGARQLQRDKAPQMAAALAFRTLFGLLPVVVVTAILVRALRGSDAFLGLVDNLVGAFGLDNITVVGANNNSEDVMTMGEWLNNIVTDLAGMNVAAIGWVGVGVLLYSGIGLMVTIENSFNSIYRAPEGRGWMRRVLLYWFILTIGPLAIALLFVVDTWAGNWIESIAGWQWLLTALATLWSLAMTWLFMFIVYRFVPNTNVANSTALVGAFVAAALLLIGKRTMGAYIENAVSLRQLYGSLGLIPLFMFWVYVMWLVVLFGLEVASTLQYLQGRNLDQIEQRQQTANIVDPTAIVSLMEVIADRFAQGQPSTPRQLADASGLDETVVDRMLAELMEHNLVHRLDREDFAITLASPPDKIPADTLMRLGYELADASGSRKLSKLVQRLREAQQSIASSTTLASTDQAPAG